MNEDSNSLGCSFRKRDNANAPIQFGRERQSQHLKIRFFIKDIPIHLHISNTTVIRLVKQNSNTTICVSPALKSTSYFKP